MLGLAAPSGAVPMTDTLSGTVTQILNPDTAFDWVVGTPITVEAEWDTDDIIDFAVLGFTKPGELFWVPLNDNPRASITITLGSETWTIADQDHYNNPLLLFDAEGDFLGPTFGGPNSNGAILGTSTAIDLIFPGNPDRLFGSFRAGTADDIGVIGLYDVPGWDGTFPALVPEPGTLALLSLGLLGLGVTRRRTN
jgi:hypothetical protein